MREKYAKIGASNPKVYEYVKLKKLIRWDNYANEFYIVPK